MPLCVNGCAAVVFSGMKLTAALFLLLTIPAAAQTTIALWPSGHVPLATATADADVPKLTAYPASGDATHPAIIVMPGGGYSHLATDKEGTHPAEWLALHGVSAYVLQYRLTPAYKWPAPALDASRAIRYLRTHASELHLDPNKIGVWGFSAGGHLAAWVSTTHTMGNPTAADPLDRVSDRPDFAVICYGRFDLTTPDIQAPVTPTSPGMAAGLGTTSAEIEIMSRITTDTSPAFLYSTTGDQTVNSINSAEYYVALKRLKVPAELHIFELGAHGSGLGDNALPTPTPAPPELAIWPTLLTDWLQQNKWMPQAAKP